MLENQLFDKIEKLTISIDREFKFKGVVLPCRDQMGNIHIGNFIVSKKDNVWYVKNDQDKIIVGPLNLGKTAIIIANDLALGRSLDYDLVNKDKWYGFKEFDEFTAKIHANKARKKYDANQEVHNLELAKIASMKKKFYKESIDSRFNNLCKLI